MKELFKKTFQGDETNVADKIMAKDTALELPW